MRRDAAHFKVELLNDNKGKSVTALFQGGRSKGYVGTAQLSEKEYVPGLLKQLALRKHMLNVISWMIFLLCEAQTRSDVVAPSRMIIGYIFNIKKPRYYSLLFMLCFCFYCKREHLKYDS
jgi:hypothetical protein